METNESLETSSKLEDSGPPLPEAQERIKSSAAVRDKTKPFKEYMRVGGSLCGTGDTLDIRTFMRTIAAQKQATERKRGPVGATKGNLTAASRKSPTRDFPDREFKVPSVDIDLDTIEGIDYFELKPYHYDQIRGERLRCVLKRDKKLNPRMEASREKNLLEKEKENVAAALLSTEVKKPLQKRSLVSGSHEKDSFLRGFASRSGSHMGSFSKFSSFGSNLAKASVATSVTLQHDIDESLSDPELHETEHPQAFTKRFEPDYDTVDIKLLKVRLEETETIYLYSYDSLIADVNSDLGAVYKKQIERVASVSAGNVPERSDQWTQIVAPPRMDRSHQIPEVHLVNVETNVCFSQILDDLAREAEKDQPRQPPLSDDSSTSLGDSDTSKGDILLLTSPEFQRTYDRILRTMDSLHFSQKQLTFRHKMLIDPKAPSAEFSYEIELLWVFKSEKLLMKNLKVVSLCWNPINVNVLAVGYAGTDTNVGYVCVWNVKHISKYDRSFKFKSRVTYVEFSREYPSLLAVAFESGGIAVVNISWKRLFIVNSKPGHIFSDCRPVWQFSWMKVDSGEEVPITCGDNGFMYQLRKDVTFAHSQLLVLSHKLKNLKGIEQLGMPEVKTERPGITCMARHPTDAVSFLAGTTDGCVHICSTNFRNQHLDAFAAHSGAVRGINFHPHLEHLFLTYGDDHFVRVWALGIFLPVFTFSARSELVSCAVWSPANAEILISLSGVFLDIWDMRRDLARPVRTWENPKGLANTRILFDAEGSNVTVGDVGGNVIVSGLRCMPFSHLLPREATAQAVEKVLMAKGELEVLQKLRNIGPPFGGREEENLNREEEEEEELPEESRGEQEVGNQ